MRTTAKRYPGWQFVAAALLGIAVFALEGWFAYRFLGWPTKLARQAVLVCWTVVLLFTPLLYRAYESRFRDRNATIVPRVAGLFAFVLSLVVLYFLDKSGFFDGNATARMLTLIITVASLAGGLFFTVFAVKYDLE